MEHLAGEGALQRIPEPVFRRVVAGLILALGVVMFFQAGRYLPASWRSGMFFFRKLLATSAPAATVLVRFLVGCVFLSEGVQKFLLPDSLGIGRFAKIGIPWPEFTAPFVGVFEVTCGVLILAGLLTRLAAVPLIVVMLVAIATTKVPILQDKGFWAMAHEARTDWSMLLGSLFLLAVGAGPWSLDAWMSRRENSRG